MGRRPERDALDHLLAQAQAGRSGTLVVRGEAGIGKSALLEHLRETAASRGFRVESSLGVEAEAQFAYAGLHQLCGLLLGRLGALPEPQQAALGVAFGERAGAPPDRFLVALATLSLVAEVAEEGPLLCVVDDAQWLDEASAQVLAFVARRLAAERVALVFGLRDTGADHPIIGLPELPLRGLGEGDARALLASTVRGPLDGAVRDRIVAEARGNPLALLELPRNTRAATLAGGFELPETASVPGRIEEGFRRRSVNLPGETRLLLLVAAADPTGQAELLWRAAAHLGVATEAAAPAEAAGLLEITTQVRFRHPLVRSAVYRAATPPDRRRAHAALAQATDPQVDPDRRAWHRAKAVQGTDEDAAAELERSADRARARGGQAAAAAFLQEATTLTPDPARRAIRALQAAHARYGAGGAEPALELVAVAEAGPLDALNRARLELLRAQITFHTTRGSAVPGMLLGAATTLAPLDADLARETFLHALDAAIITSGLDRRGEIARAAEQAPPPSGPPRPEDLLLDGLVAAFTRGHAAGVPGMRRALEAFNAPAHRSADGRAGGTRRWLWLASRSAVALFDDELVQVLGNRNVRLAREAGELATLPAALLFLAGYLVLTGDLAQAAELAAEEQAITHAIGSVPLRHAPLMLAAWRGDAAETEELCTASLREAEGREEGTEVALAHYTVAVLRNGHGNYPAALEAATLACRYSPWPHASLALPELIEAAARSNQMERAADALTELTSRTGASGTPWALGLAARSRALVSIGPDAEECYLEAIAHLRNCRMGVYLARTHLVYGEWLRREGRRQDARAQLRTAHGLLSDMGLEAFAERAARELRATGEHPRRRNAQAADALTAQELHIARLVATGATSREAAEQLFLSPRTIEAHLRSIFRKLGITSRRQLSTLQLT